MCEEKRMGKENLSVNGRVEDKKHNFVGRERVPKIGKGG